MNKYTNGKIYKIIDNTNGNIYIGSTIRSLKRRLQLHIHDLKKKVYLTSSEIIKNGNYKIELIENYSCNNDEELRKREQYYIDNNKCVNKKKSYSNRKEIKLYFKNYHKKYDKEWYDNNKKYKKKYMKELRIYKNSFGGDPRSNNNLLLIDINLFI